MADARARAESLAALSDVELGEVQIISEVIGQSGFPMARGTAFDMAIEESMVPSISPGQLSYSVQIQITFGLQ